MPRCYQIGDRNEEHGAIATDRGAGLLYQPRLSNPTTTGDFHKEPSPSIEDAFQLFELISAAVKAPDGHSSAPQMRKLTAIILIR
jgi:hypothetical protein